MLEVFLTYPTPEGSQTIPIDEERTTFGRGSEADHRFDESGELDRHCGVNRHVWWIDVRHQPFSLAAKRSIGERGRLVRGPAVDIGATGKSLLDRGLVASRNGVEQGIARRRACRRERQHQKCKQSNHNRLIA